jgi:hydrogenase/urease accessory protein HupE
MERSSQMALANQGNRIMTLELKALLAVLMLVCACPASAHLMPEKQGTVNVVGNNAYTVITVPTAALQGFDDNHDGLIDVPELARHGDLLRAQVLERFAVVDATLTPTASITWLVTPNTGDTAQAPSDYLLAMQSLTFASPPGRLSMSYELFGTKGNGAQLTLTATQGTDKEVIMLTPGHSQSRLFRSGFEVFTDFIRMGAGHILGGLDHLAFLLTAVLAGAGLRYWLTVITTFTLAHSITLALSLWGVVSLPASVVEPAILASIVVMGADAVINRNRRLWLRAAIVFACGLVHGLGFASAIGAIGVDPQHRLFTLAGFNLGIELGQALFVSAVLALTLIVKRQLAAAARDSAGRQ